MNEELINGDVYLSEYYLLQLNNRHNMRKRHQRSIYELEYDLLEGDNYEEENCVYCWENL